MDFENWMKLPKKLRKKAFFDCYKILVNRSKDQLAILKKALEDHTQKDIRHDFLATTVFDFWEDIEFIFFLSNKKWQSKSIYPARTALERFAKLHYLNTKNEDEQKRLVRIEALKLIKHFYRISEVGEEINNLAIDSFNALREKDDPTITDGNKKFDPLGFPDIARILEGLNNMEGMGSVVKYYKDLCNTVHGHFYDSIITKGDQEIINRTACLGVFLCMKILEIVDWHLFDKKITESTKTAISEAEAKFKSI